MADQLTNDQTSEFKEAFSLFDKDGDDNAGAKASFHKPSNDPSNRKYRRRSPVSGSSSDGERVCERRSIPTHRKDERRDVDRDHHRSRYSRDHGGSGDRRSYNDHRRHDDYKKRAEEDHKNLSPRGSRREFEQNRSRDKYSQDGSGHRSSRDKYKKEDVRHHHHHHKDTSWRDSKELDTRFEKGRFYDHETRGVEEPRQLLDDQSLVTAKKSKFSMVNEVQSSSSKQGQEFGGKANTEQDFVKDSDIDAAKIAAMKAAELVNRNLIGTGIMSTDQKKKLLWGSKKSTPTEEAAHRWDTSMFSDRERQEKFNKLMSLRLIWEIVGCEGGAETRDPRQQSRRKTERTPDRLGEAVHCWPSSKRWPYCRFRSLITVSCWYMLYLLSATTMFLLSCFWKSTFQPLILMIFLYRLWLLVEPES